MLVQKNEKQQTYKELYGTDVNKESHDLILWIALIQGFMLFIWIVTTHNDEVDQKAEIDIAALNIAVQTGHATFASYDIANEDDNGKCIRRVLSRGRNGSSEYICVVFKPEYSKMYSN